MANTITGVIEYAKRLKNSVNGNPHFEIGVVSDDLEYGYDHLTTSFDASCNYDVENVQRSGETVTLGLTRAGRVQTITRV